MKVISIWQPYASLLVHGHKMVETRGWPAPKSLIGKRIGIASTKTIRPEQRVHYLDPSFLRSYRKCGLPELERLPHGCFIGTVYLNSCDVITVDDLDEITEDEKHFGWWTPGRFAWRVRDPIWFRQPFPVRGAQGIWDFNLEAIIEQHADPHSVVQARTEHHWEAV